MRAVDTTSPARSPSRANNPFGFSPRTSTTPPPSSSISSGPSSRSSTPGAYDRAPETARWSSRRDGTSGPIVKQAELPIVRPQLGDPAVGHAHDHDARRGPIAPELMEPHDAE